MYNLIVKILCGVLHARQSFKRFFMDKKRLEKYADLIVKCGINVQPGQEVIIRCDLDQPDFVAMVAEKCYQAGAERVTVEWSYMPVTKLSYIYRTEQSL